MAKNENNKETEIQSIGPVTTPVSPALEAEQMGKALKKIIEHRHRRKRQVSIMGAKQSITFSLRKRYIERARITAEYMGISMSTYIERCINKDNQRYQRILSVLGQEVRKHDEIVGRLNEAAKNVNYETKTHGIEESLLLEAMNNIKNDDNDEEDIDTEFDDE